MWLLSHSDQIPNIPDWLGFNALHTQDKFPRQKVTYLTPINMSPTVVAKTLEMCLGVCGETGQQYIAVTYDLAIAKMALNIQMDESPKFDNIVINLGAFHIEMAFFKSLGKLIDGCGLLEVY